MAKWLENTDIKKLLCFMFSVIIVLGTTVYKVDMNYLDDKLSNILDEVKEIKTEQAKLKDSVDAKIEKELSKVDVDIDSLDDRIREVELKLAGK